MKVQYNGPVDRFFTSLTFGLITVGTVAFCDWLIDLRVDRQAERCYAALLGGGERLDAIILGSSHGLYGIDPAILEGPGIRPFNFSNQGSGPLYYAEWYDLYRRYQGPARWALISVDWFWVKWWRRLDHDADSLPLDVWLRRLADPANEASTLVFMRFALIREHSQFAFRLFGEESTFPIDESRSYRGGSALRPGGYAEQGQAGKRAYRGPTPPGSWVAFRRLCTRLREDDARVVFVQTPEYLPDAGEHPQENAAIAALARDYGWPFLNYNAERASRLNHERDMFADWNHLNAVGRARFTQSLRRDLERLGALPAGNR